MKSRRAALVATTGLALAAALFAAPAGAQESEFAPLDITPTSGPAGTSITVSGDDCGGEQAFNAFVQVYFANETDVLNAVETEIAETGSWSTQIQVPPAPTPRAPTPSSRRASWTTARTSRSNLEYEEVAFDVTGDVVTPSQPAPTPAPAPTAAAPAAPVPGDPTFSG
jgi:hypothetical protein